MSNNFKRELKKGWHDFILSFIQWRIFYIIGINDIRKRYSRSKIGQFWLTLSLALNITSLGIVWSYLFKISIKEYIPFLALGNIFWTYISSCVLEGATLYISSVSYLRELNIPKLAYLNSLIIRNLVIFFHNILVLIPIYFFCALSISFQNILLSILGLILTTFFLYPSIMLIALFSLRFRDFPNIAASFMQIIFYVTPIMWKINLMPVKFHNYFLLNPFAIFLSLCRDPLISEPIIFTYWIVALVYIILAWIIAFPFFCKFRARIIYWL